MDTLLQVLQSEPKPPSAVNSQCDKSLEAICLKCLRRDPSDRYATARELAQDLHRFLNGQAVQARPLRFHQRAWAWLRDVPLASALMGRRRVAPTKWQLRFQWVAMALPVLLIAAALVSGPLAANLRLRSVEIAGGQAGGAYDTIANSLSEALSTPLDRAIRPLETAGSLSSLAGLIDGEYDLAIVQDNTMRSEQVQVLAPLYLEMVMLFARVGSGIESVEDLEGKSVAVGPAGSGARFNAGRILASHGIELREIAERPLKINDPKLDAVLITAKLDDDRMQSLIDAPSFSPVSIRSADSIPGLREHVLHPEDLPDANPEDLPLETAATMAILAVRRDAPAWFVTKVLEALYQPGNVAERQDCYSAEAAAAWSDLNLHPTARQFYRKFRKP